MSDTALSPDAKIGALAVGDPIRDWQTSVSRARQRQYHAAAEVAENLFADWVDPSILANDTILATRYMKLRGVDGVHAGQRVQQLEPVRFDEPLTLKGRVVSLKSISKGQLSVTRFDFIRPDGSVPVISEITSLKVDATAMQAAGGGRTGLQVDGQRHLAHKNLSPERVAAYSAEFPTYVVHFEPEAARAIGLRAPIAQGLMSLTWMLEAVACDGAFEAIDFAAQFRQPIFWDDEVDILHDDARGYFCANGSGEICSRGSLDQIAR